MQQQQQQQQDSAHQNNSMTHLNEPLDQLNAMEKSLNDQVGLNIKKKKIKTYNSRIISLNYKSLFYHL